MSDSEFGSDRSLRLTLEDEGKLGACIKVIGVGGGGSNAINRMLSAGLGGEDVEFIVANTDLQALQQNAAPVRLQIGAKLTNGLGAGADPDIGRRAALEDTEQLIGALSGADMVFVAAGLGGGTGTGAAPVVTALASELGALTVATVTKPFAFEGRRRTQQAERGLEELRGSSDAVIAIPNERLLATVDHDLPLTRAFEVVDDVLHQAVRGISDLILVPGLINLDFADVKSIMAARGIAIMGTGVGDGDSRSLDAAKRAVSSPLLEDTSLDGARSVIVNVTGGSDLSMVEISEATGFIQETAHPDANIIFGAVVDSAMDGRVKITVIATDFGQEATGEAGAAVAAGGDGADTPVDLHAYSTRPPAPQTPGLAVGQPRASSSFAVSRRPLIDLPDPSHPEGLAGGGDPASDADTSGGTAQDDVPAFLRPAAR